MSGEDFLSLSLIIDQQTALSVSLAGLRLVQLGFFRSSGPRRIWTW